ncbi:TetR/AcrR family transcriptional regulator [Saccharopolyspora elongata]|uniref:TetR family transcriptional regulator n=1 Tax=Saccharopolyspora elongata TaxID=2530387 RepID=A0A4R4ZD69_9PSEU|nr:TetR family transcriptional regulator [Saccharopolyspora elongata]TDD55219.1 TetR family transcriptional regulator [Saccharopolyspora elongata]
MSATSVERGRDVRRRLLRAAVELIPELGWNAVSTRSVAERAGVTPGLVHYHFSSLQALLREAVVDAMSTELSSVLPALEQAEDLAAGLDMLVSRLDAYDGMDAASLLFVEAYLAATRDEELRERLAAQLGGLRRELAAWLAEHGHGAPAATASILAAAVDGVLLHRALIPDSGAEELAPVLRRLVTSLDEQSG